MSSNKGLDFVAGRLGNVAEPNAPSPAGSPKKSSSYCAERLGITLEAQPDRAEQPPPAVDQTPPAPVTSHGPPPTPAGDPLPTPRAEPAWLRWTAVLPERIRPFAQQPKFLAAAVGLVAAGVLACLFLGGGDAPPNGPEGPSPAAKPSPIAPRSAAAAKPAAPDRPIGGNEATPREDRPVAATGNARPTFSPKATAKAVKSGAASLMGWFKTAGDRVKQRPPAAIADAAVGPTPAPAADEDGPASEVPPKGEPDSPPEVEAPPALEYIACPAGIRFAGVIQQPDGARANINGRFVRVGSKVGNATVVSIHPTSVEMELNGKRFFVGFGSPK